MPAATTAPQPRRFQCRHIFTDGHRCGSPCLRAEEFCFYHHTSRGRAASPNSSAIPTIDLSQGEHQKSPFTLPSLEDRSAIQHAIGEVLNRLASNQLDPRRAGLLLYGLQIASLNLPAPPATRPQPHTSPVEEIVSDPDLGPIAPSTEILPPTPDDQPTTLAQLFLQELRRGNPTTPPEPHILEDLKASTDDPGTDAPNSAVSVRRPITNHRNTLATPRAGRLALTRHPPAPHRFGYNKSHVLAPLPSYRPHHSRRLGLSR